MSCKQVCPLRFVGGGEGGGWEGGGGEGKGRGGEYGHDLCGHTRRLYSLSYKPAHEGFSLTCLQLLLVNMKDLACLFKHITLGWYLQHRLGRLPFYASTWILRLFRNSKKKILWFSAFFFDCLKGIVTRVFQGKSGLTTNYTGLRISGYHSSMLDIFQIRKISWELLKIRNKMVLETNTVLQNIAECFFAKFSHPS